MNIKNLATLALGGLLLLGSTVPAMAHETKCPYCRMDVVQDTKTEDNEVVLRYGNKRIEYRCVLCAIAQAKTKFKGDVTIIAPSTTKGKPITITRTGGKWAAPAGTVFVYQKGSHSKCQDLYRAAASEAAATGYAKAKGLSEAKNLSLTEMVELSK